MRAMVLHEQRRPLQLSELPTPAAGPGQLLLQVKACGICRTDLQVVEGDLKHPTLPLIPGYQINGGFAEYTVADPDYCFPIPAFYNDQQAAPLLCAGLIGYRAYRLLQSCQTIGLYGFGAAAHILIQLARHRGQAVCAAVLVP